jgi:hypothetical protein
MPQIAGQFTLGELACLRIVAHEVREGGFCVLTLGAIAAPAGCCRELARRAVREAGRDNTGENYHLRSATLRLVNANWEGSRCLCGGHPMEDKLFFGLMVATMVALEVGERLLQPAPVILCGLTAVWFAS